MQSEKGCWLVGQGVNLLSVPVETRSQRALAGQTNTLAPAPNRVPARFAILGSMAASHILVLRPVFRVAFVKFGGPLALVVHLVSTGTCLRVKPLGSIYGERGRFLLASKGGAG